MKGFTLIEMLVVIAIAAIIGSVFAPGVLKDIYSASFESDLRSLSAAHLELNRGVAVKSLPALTNLTLPLPGPLSAQFVGSVVSYQDVFSKGLVGSYHPGKNLSILGFEYKNMYSAGGYSPSELIRSQTAVYFTYDYAKFNRIFKIPNFKYVPGDAYSGYLDKILRVYSITHVECVSKDSLCYFRQSYIKDFADDEYVDSIKQTKLAYIYNNNAAGVNVPLVDPRPILETWFGENTKNVLHLVDNGFGSFDYAYDNSYSPLLNGVSGVPILSDEATIASAVQSTFVKLGFLNSSGDSIDNVAVQYRKVNYK